MKFIRENIRFLFVFILPVYFFIVQNTIKNKHTHFYANGIVVTHSHPVNTKDGNPVNGHEHTKSEICLFHQVNIDFFTFTPDQYFESYDSTISNEYFLFNETFKGFPITHQPLTRGPPKKSTFVA